MPLKLDKFVMATASHNAQDTIKCIVTLLGDNITNAVSPVALCAIANLEYVGLRLWRER